MLSPAPMAFKTNRPPGSLPLLSGLSVLAVSGPDAAAFLQAQTMNDVRALGVGRWHWNGWLNAKGRVIALFALLRLQQDEFLLVLLDFPAYELMPLLQRFVFRSKVQLRTIDNLLPAADMMPPPGDGWPRDQLAGDVASGIGVDFSGDTLRRHLWLLPADCPALASADADIDANWLNADIAHGLPRLDVSQRESWTPQMLSLERLAAFSLGKGCYPGQEIVARTHYLGKAKRQLARISGAQLLLGAPLKNDTDTELGAIICVAHDACSALAVVASNHSSSHASISDRRVRIVALMQGLQRPV